jgi:hypothetical protein
MYFDTKNYLKNNYHHTTKHLYFLIQRRLDPTHHGEEQINVKIN